MADGKNGGQSIDWNDARSMLNSCTEVELREKIDQCNNQMERVSLFYAIDDSKIRRGIHSKVERSIYEHIGTERSIDEMWEVIHFQDRNSIYNDKVVSLIIKYVEEAQTSFQLWRIYMFVKSATSGCFFRSLSRYRIALKILKVADDDRGRELSLKYLMGGDKRYYYDYVYSEFWKR